MFLSRVIYVRTITHSVFLLEKLQTYKSRIVELFNIIDVRRLAFDMKYSLITIAACIKRALEYFPSGVRFKCKFRP